MNKINRLKGTAFLAVDLVLGEIENVLIAVSNAQKGKSNIAEIDEVSVIHINNSMELVTMIAAPFDKKIKKFLLFMLLGIDIARCIPWAGGFQGQDEHGF